MSAVTADAVRLALDDLDASALSNEKIDAAIEIAETLVDQAAADDVAADVRRSAIIDVAKYRVVLANRQAFVDQIGSASSTTGFDISARLEALRVAHDAALNRVSGSTPRFSTRSGYVRATDRHGSEL